MRPRFTLTSLTGLWLEDRRYLPVAPADGLFVLRLGYCDDARFARLFAEAWRAIPPDDREEIVSTRWRPIREWLSETSNPHGLVPIPGSYDIAPVLLAVPNGTPPPYEDLVPWTGRLDVRNSVWNAAAIDAAPDEVVRAAVGCELAETLLWPDVVWRRDEAAQRWVAGPPVWHGPDDPPQDRRGVSSLMFDAVRSLAEGWGFEPMLVYKWTDANGDRFTRAA